MSLTDADNLLTATYLPDVSYMVLITSHTGGRHTAILRQDGYLLLHRWHHHRHHRVGGGVNSGGRDFQTTAADVAIVLLLGINPNSLQINF